MKTQGCENEIQRNPSNRKWPNLHSRKLAQRRNDMLKRKRSSNTEKTATSLRGVLEHLRGETAIQAAIRAWIEAGFHPVMARAMTGDNPKASLALLAEVRGSR